MLFCTPAELASPALSTYCSAAYAGDKFLAISPRVLRPSGRPVIKRVTDRSTTRRTVQAELAMGYKPLSATTLSLSRPIQLQPCLPAVCVISDADSTVTERELGVGALSLVSVLHVI